MSDKMSGKMSEKNVRKQCTEKSLVGMALRRNGATSEWCYVGMALRRNGATLEWRYFGMLLRRNGATSEFFLKEQFHN